MDSLMYTSYVFIALAIIAVIVVGRTATVVPQQSAYVIENLGKYSRTLQAGFHILIPFVERIAYRHSLKELALDIAEQICITRDNVQVGVDAVLYMQVLDPHLASYGITNYGFAIAQLAQTTLRSEIGKIELDRTFEARGAINANVVGELDKASAAWGVKVLRYEIKNITPPKDVLQAMEKQMRAEREKRAVVLTSEGERDAKINSAEGDKQRVIKQSEANQQQQINEANGQAAAILAVATATAEGLRQVGIALSDRGGIEAMQLRIGEEYVKQFGKLAQAGTTLVVPANLTDLASIVTMATSIARKPPAIPAACACRRSGRPRRSASWNWSCWRRPRCRPRPSPSMRCCPPFPSSSAHCTSPTRITCNGSSPRTWRAWGAASWFGG